MLLGITDNSLPKWSFLVHLYLVPTFKKTVGGILNSLGSIWRAKQIKWESIQRTNFRQNHPKMDPIGNFLKMKFCQKVCFFVENVEFYAEFSPNFIIFQHFFQKCANWRLFFQNMWLWGKIYLFWIFLANFEGVNFFRGASRVALGAPPRGGGVVWEPWQMFVAEWVYLILCPIFFVTLCKYFKK